MANLNLSEKLFYKDENVIIHNVIEGNIRYFLIYPTNQQVNFAKFIALYYEDITKKGTSEYSNDVIIRKQLLEDVKHANEFIKSLNSNFIHSRINQLRELPVAELEDVLSENKPFDLNKYRIIVSQIQQIIHNNYSLMTSSNIKDLSTQYAILCIIQKEQDKDFIVYLNNNLSKENNHKDLEILREEYYISRISLDISNYKQTINEQGKIIITGFNSKNEQYEVELPKGIDMLQAFNRELYLINNKKQLIGLAPKIVAIIIFDKLIRDYQGKIITPTPIIPNANNDTSINQSKQNEIIGTKKGEEVITKTTDQIQTTTFEFNEEKNAPSEVPIIKNSQVDTYNNIPNIQQTQTEPIEQSKGKKRVLVPSDNNNTGFIKFGTIILFASSLILTLVSLALLIAA